MIVGITGGIGSGKSTVAKIFATLGIPVYDADAAAKKLMHTNADLKEQLITHFGNATYQHGILDRKYLANIVFKDKSSLNLLNSLVHPYTIADANYWAAQQKAAYVLKEAALLFETEAFHYVDYTIGVTAPKALRIQRVMQRDTIDREAVLSRMHKQMDDSIKMKLCDFVINNNEQELIIPQVLHLHTKLIALSP
jgi:dephospho-CoA kinase